MPKTGAFVTGGTGLLGSWLICDLIRRGQHDNVYVLVRAKTKAAASKRFFKFLRLLPHKLTFANIKKIIVMRGDVTAPSLGLSVHDRQVLGKTLSDVYHSAALAEFGLPVNRIYPTNVAGTKHVLNLAVDLQKIRGQKIHFHHISTIAVAGDYQGTFNESHFDLGQSFHNTYEQSKFEAERLVRDRSQELITRIYRPGIITGDSVNGITTNFKMIYQPLHFLSLNLFNEMPGDSTTAYPFVPVDKVAEAITILSRCEPITMGAYHIVGEKNVSLGQFLRAGSKILGYRMPKLISKVDFKKNSMSSAKWRLIEPFVPYFNYKVQFDAKLTKNFLDRYDFSWPKNNEKLLKKVITFCAKSNFGAPN